MAMASASRAQVEAKAKERMTREARRKAEEAEKEQLAARRWWRRRGANPMTPTLRRRRGARSGRGEGGLVVSEK